MEQQQQHSLPENVLISNLGENVYSQVCEKLKQDLEHAGKTRLIERVQLMEERERERIAEMRLFKKQFAHALIRQMKQASINVRQEKDAPRTNSWNHGDYVALREPPIRKKKKRKLKK